jgi:hypothetical protein
MDDNIFRFILRLTDMQSRNRSNYSNKDLKLVFYAKALGHPARNPIISHLSQLET